MRDAFSLGRPTRSISSPVSSHVVSTGRRLRPAGRVPDRTSLAPRAHGRRRAARGQSHLNSPQGSRFLVLFALRTTSRRGELRQRHEPPFLPCAKLFGARRTGEATVPREGKVMRLGHSPGRPARPGPARPAGAPFGVSCSKRNAPLRAAGERPAPLGNAESRIRFTIHNEPGGRRFVARAAPSRPSERAFVRTSLAPRAHGRRRAARGHSHTSSPQGSLFLVLFALPGLRRAGELKQRRKPPFLPRAVGLVARRTGEATVPREGKVMRDERSLGRPPAPASKPIFLSKSRTLSSAPALRPPGGAFVRTSLAPRAHGRRRAARGQSHLNSPQGSLFLVLFAVDAYASRGELRQRLEPPFLPAKRTRLRRRTGEATVPREGKVMRDEFSPRRPPPAAPTRDASAGRGPRGRSPERGLGRTSFAPRAHGRRRAARGHSHTSSPQGSLFLVLFTLPGHESGRERNQRREPPFLARIHARVAWRTGEATVPREGKVMRPAPSLGRPTAADLARTPHLQPEASP